MDDRAVYSILGTRVQMGITTSSQLASDLISQAYANLIAYEQYQANSDDDIGVVIKTTFMPDPVCAALAMGMMVPEWQLRYFSRCEFFDGKDRKFWSRKVMECFANRLCIPEKGNIGEIMVALYMLFCGDVLRMKSDKTLRSFSVSLEEWYNIMKQPHLDVNDVKCDVGTTGTSKMEVSFIQVCRNYFRNHGWNSNESLKWMYDAAVGTYVFSDCEEIDIVSSIRVTSSDGKTSYHPLLVCVKCGESMSPTNIKSSMDEISIFLESVRNEQNNIPALYLIIVIGGEVPASSEYNVQNLGNFPHADTYRLIAIPDNDPFDISKNVFQTTEAREVTEIYTSHPFLYSNQHQQMKNNDDVKCQGATDLTNEAFPQANDSEEVDTLLRESSSKVAKQLVKNLLGAFSAIRDNKL
jgi:hypothetical protein